MEKAKRKKEESVDKEFPSGAGLWSFGEEDDEVWFWRERMSFRVEKFRFGEHQGEKLKKKSKFIDAYA